MPNCQQTEPRAIMFSIFSRQNFSQRIAPQEETSTGLRQSALDRVPKRAFGPTDSIGEEVHIDAFGL
jgi:hypothetical protein